MSSATATSNQQDINDAVGPTVPDDLSAMCVRQTSLLNRSCQRLVLKRLSSLQKGRLYLDDQCKRYVLGENSQDDLQATIAVKNPRFYRRLVTGRSLGLAETYMDGDWECDDLPSLFRIFSRNLDWHRTFGKTLELATRAAARVGYWLARNTRSGSRRNIGAHYDLGNDFFKLFLDPGMTYSSAYFAKGTESLEEAQGKKYDELCRKLHLKASDKVLEIGSGWGGFASHAARHYGCQVTTITISKEQFEYTCRRVQEENLTEKVKPQLVDYRHIEGVYDKIASIEMIEAVGHDHLGSYFSQCHRLLKKDGLLGLQMILAPDHRYESFRKRPDWIQKHIFPGGFLPSFEAVLIAVRKTGDLGLYDYRDMTPSYARTLLLWRENFGRAEEPLKKLGFDATFIRKWNYYFSYCEAAFRMRNISVVQAVFTRPNNGTL